MSTILDALKKSEQDREIGQVPSLRTQAGPVPIKKGKSYLWFYILILFLLSGMLSYAYFAMNMSKSSESATNNIQEQVSDTTLNQEYIDIAEIEKADQALRLKQRSLSAKLVTEPKPAEENAAELPVSDSEVNMQEHFVSESAAQPVSDVPIPLVDALPLEVRQKIPPLSLDVHVYAEALEHRFVLLNMKRYVQGETTREGLLLEEIRPNDVILSQGSIRFRMLTR